MGVFCNYTLRLKIKSSNLEEALRLLNELHTDEMLLTHARGGSFGGNSDKRPIKERRWFSWLPNPDHPYRSLEEAFDNWHLVEEDIVMEFDDNGDFILSGIYDNKLGQQSFFLKHMARVLEDMIVYVKLEDYFRLLTWSIKDYVFTEEKSR